MNITNVIKIRKLDLTLFGSNRRTKPELSLLELNKNRKNYFGSKPEL